MKQLIKHFQQRMDQGPPGLLGCCSEGAGSEARPESSSALHLQRGSLGEPHKQ